MERTDFEVVFDALNRAGVHYLVVGGVAVVLHGHPRFTADLDLVVRLDEVNARLTIEALAVLGYRPRAPVPAVEFADPACRRSWAEDKGMVAFSLWSAAHPATEIDLFIREPFPFAEAEARALRADLGAVTVPVASLQDLIRLKRQAGRAKDLDDVAALEAIERETTRG